MDTTRLPYKKDIYGNDLFASVSWAKGSSEFTKPIALIFHAGGLFAGSSDIVPKTQIDYLCSRGFLVIIPNYRLAPQVTAKEAFGDCEDAFDWATTTLVGTLSSTHGLRLNASKVVAMGHSSGGTLALHIASCKPIQAATAFHPSLFNADLTTSAHRPSTAPPFGQMPDFIPSDEDWASIKPSTHQISEASLARPGTVPPARNRYQAHLLKHGQWLPVVQPDGDYAAIDPMTRVSGNWPPVMIVCGELDVIPGSQLEYVERAVREMKAVGVKEVELCAVGGEGHMFDLPPTVGTTDLGPRWEAVVKGLEWLTGHV